MLGAKENRDEAASSMRITLSSLHMKNRVLNESPSVSILPLEFKPKRVHTEMWAHGHIPLCRMEGHGPSIARLIPEKRSPGCCDGSWMPSHHGWRIWRRRTFIIWWRSSSLCEIHSCDIVDAGPSLIFSTWKLSDEVFLCVASYLRRCSRDHEVPGDVSPITFPIFF